MRMIVNNLNLADFVEKRLALSVISPPTATSDCQECASGNCSNGSGMSRGEFSSGFRTNRQLDTNQTGCNEFASGVFPHGPSQC
jgi:hypothetical protein